MNLVPMADILNKANEGGYAVGGFNINNMEFLQAIVQAAEETRSPLILQTSERSSEVHRNGLCSGYGAGCY